MPDHLKYLNLGKKELLKVKDFLLYVGFKK